MKSNNDIVMLNLDKPREVRFGHKAIKMLCSMLDKSYEEMTHALNNAGPEDIEKIMYCAMLSGAQKNGEKLELKDMEDLLDKAPYMDVINAMNEALEVAFGVADEKNLKGIAEKKK